MLFFSFLESSQPVCLGRTETLDTSPGYISTPNYGRGNYGHNDQCTWILKAGKGQKIKLVFEKFSLEDSSNCVKDSLIIFDIGQGDYDDEMSPSSRPPLRDLCGHQLPTPLISDTNAVEIKFISDSTGEERGANIYYEFIDAEGSRLVPIDRGSEYGRGRGLEPQYTTVLRWHRTRPHFTQSRTQKPTRRYRTRVPTTRRLTTTEAPEYEDSYENYETSSEMVPIPKIVQGPEGIVAMLNQGEGNNPEISNAVGKCANKSSILTVESGVIESPGFQRGFYPDNDDCEWLIITEAKKNIKLYFESFDIELEPMCLHDTVTIYDGPSSDTSEPLGIYCGQGQPEALESTGPYMLVRFHTDAAGTGHGFKLYYNTSYVTNTEDNYINMMPPGSPYETYSYPEPEPEPEFQPVAGMDKFDNATAMQFLQALLKGVVGGGSKLDTTTRSSRKMEPFAPILQTAPRFRPDFDINDYDFGETPMKVHTEPVPSFLAQTMAPYTWQPSTIQTTTISSEKPTYGPPMVSTLSGRCRGKIGVIVLNAVPGKIGSLATPNFGKSYYETDDICRWEIRSPYPNTRIRLRFVKFHLESGNMECRNDYVEIFDGPGANFPLLGRHCGEHIPESIVSSGNQLAIRFVSDGMLQYAGFFAEYTAEGAGSNVVPQIEPAVEPPQIQEPETTMAPQELPQSLPQAIPQAIPEVIAEPERCDGRLHQLVATSMTQFFTSPNFGPGRTYADSDFCFWIITAPSDTSNKVRLNFRFFDMEPPSPRCSPGDSLSIFDGPAETAPLLAILCGHNLPGEIESRTSSSLFIKFQSNNFKNFPGFVAAFEDTGVPLRPSLIPATTTSTTTTSTTRRLPTTRRERIDFYESDDEIYDDYDIERMKLKPLHRPVAKTDIERRRNFKSSSSGKWMCRDRNGGPVYLEASEKPNYLKSHRNYGRNRFYEPNMNCAWVISVGDHFEKKRVKISFNDFNIERGMSDVSCLSDYVVIFDGPSEESETVRKLCGNDGRDFTFISNQPEILIKFYSDRTVEDSGFYLRYESANVQAAATRHIDMKKPCNGKAIRLPPASTEQVKVFASPNYGNGRKYFPNDSCKWLINAGDRNGRVKLRFATFFVENRTPNCANDHITVYDGFDESAPVIGKFCGLNPPPELTSSGRKMMIRFYSDNSIEYSGFTAEYTSFQEPSQPQLVPKRDPIPNRYSQDYAQYSVLFEEMITTMPTSTAFSKVPAKPRSKPRTLEILSRGSTGSQEPINYLHYDLGKAKELRCNGQVLQVKLNASLGANQEPILVMSPNFAGGQYVYNDECMWAITAEPEELKPKIRIHFDTFNVQYSDGCFKDRLLIYDGGIAGPRTFGPFCGQMQLPDIVTQTNKALIKFNSDEHIETEGFQIRIQILDVGKWKMEEQDTLAKDSWLYEKSSAPSHQTSSTGAHGSGKTSHPVADASWFKINNNYKQSDVDALTLPSDIGQRTSRPILILPDFKLPSYKSIKSANLHRNNFQATTSTTTTTTTTTPDFITLDRSRQPCRESVFDFGWDLPASKRILASPADEDNGRYFANDICFYKVTAPEGKRIRLQFFEPFDLESSVTCLYDRLSIFDGKDEKSPLAGIFCGMEAPEPYISTENSVFLKFETDSTQNKAGFIVQFSYV